MLVALGVGYFDPSRIVAVQKGSVIGSLCVSLDGAEVACPESVVEIVEYLNSKGASLTALRLGGVPFLAVDAGRLSFVTSAVADAETHAHLVTLIGFKGAGQMMLPVEGHSPDDILRALWGGVEA